MKKEKAVGLYAGFCTSYETKCLPFIHALRHRKALSFYPPARAGRPLLWRRYTRTFNFQNARPGCRHPAGGLLPRLLTLTVLADGGSFLLHALTLADYFPLRSGMPCVARTFLSRPKPAAASRPTALMSQKYFFFSS